MPLITLTGRETPAENVGKALGGEDIARLDTFTKERTIGPNSTICIESIDDLKLRRKKVWEGFATDGVSINLDPGWYRYKCVWKDQYQEQHQFVNQFFVQITYEMFRQIAPLRPRISKGRQTSGGIRYSCGMSGCNSVLTTKYAIIEHEKNHEGSTVFRDVEWRPDIAADGTMTSKGIVILGGPPKGAIAAEPKKATLPPQFVQQMEAERTTAPPPAVAETPAAPKRRGRPPGSKGKGNPGALAAYRAKKAEEKAVQESLVNA